MKKVWALVLAISLMFTGVSCAKGDSQADDDKEEKIEIVATVFPIYDWVREIIGQDSGFDITLLADSGVDFHSFQPSAEDVLKINKSDIFLYIGGISDQWVEEVVKDSKNDEMKSLSMVSALGDMIKMVDEDEEHHHEHEHAGDEEIDEHVWLSLKNAQFCVKDICTLLSEAYPERKEDFNENAETYLDKLRKLDGEYETAVAESAGKRVLFGDRFPFRYMMDDYHITYFAAFPGCSSENEASFEKVISLANKADQLKIKNLIAIEDSKQDICNSIIENTKEKNQSVVTMDSMQSIGKDDIEEGATYLDVMEKNLQALKKALE